MAVAPAATSCADGVGGGVEVLEADQRQRRVAAQRHGVEHRLGDEGQRPLRADDQPPEDLQRRVGVQERAQAVAGGVLDLELGRHPGGQLGVGAQLVADLDQPGGQLGSGGGERAPRRPGAAVSITAPLASTSFRALTVW